MIKEFLPTDPEGRYFHMMEETAELITELSQLQKAMVKAGRWGMGSVNPLLPEDQQVRNVDEIMNCIVRVNNELLDFGSAVGAAIPDFMTEIEHLRKKAAGDV
jgi:hypothetical protein